MIHINETLSRVKRRDKLKTINVLVRVILIALFGDCLTRKPQPHRSQLSRNPCQVHSQPHLSLSIYVYFGYGTTIFSFCVIEQLFDRLAWENRAVIPC